MYLIKGNSNIKGKFTSLKTKAFRIILFTSLLLLILGSAIGLLLHTYSSLKSYKTEGNHLIDVMMSLEDSKYIEKLMKETWDVYQSIPEKERKDWYDYDKHDKLFAHLVDDDYKKAKNIMVPFWEKTGQQNLWLVLIDWDLKNIIYVMDADTSENEYTPGFFLPYKDYINEVDKVCDSDWRLSVVQADKYGFIGADYRKIYSSDGKVIGYVEMDLDLTRLVFEMNKFLRILIPASLLLVIILAFLTSKLLKHYIISHLKALADAANAYIERDTVSIDENTPSLFAPLNLKTSDEIEYLWTSMAGMELDVKNSLIQIRDMTTVQERMNTELSIASKIQMGMLPNKFPDSPDFELYASMAPAKEVGGDLYDFFMIDDDHLAMVIADVSGKGVSAALFMVVAKTLIKNQTEQGLQDPGDIFDHVNKKLMEVNRARLFVTAWLGILELSTGKLTYANAGHMYPALKRSGRPFEFVRDVHNVMLAASRRAKFKSGEFTLAPGDVLFQYTDGVTEANNAESVLIGDGPILMALNKTPDAAPEEIIADVNEEIEIFTAGAPQFDDITMLCVRYRAHSVDHKALLPHART